MKKIRWLLLVLLLVSFPAGVKLYAQGSAKNQLNISVANIDYDDVSFAKLKESFRNNKKIQDIKQSFSENTAKLSLVYPGDANDLWDEIPAGVKQLFKITTQDSKR